MKSPWLFVPTLYFQQGIPVIIVQQVSVIFYKKMGIPNEQIGLWTSLIILPWILKMLWGPWVEMHWNRRSWVLAMQLAVCIGLYFVAAFASVSSFLLVTLGIFVLIAFFSATHDIALDGYYMLALPKNQQAFFMGIRTTAFRLAMIFGNGALVVLAGNFEAGGLSVAESWKKALMVAAGVYGFLMLYAHLVMPKLKSDVRLSPAEDGKKNEVLAAFQTFFKQPKIIPILLFMLLYRFGESMLTKMAPPFLLDEKSVGGLAFSTKEVGYIIGSVGVLSLVIGGVLGGIIISKYGLKKCMWPMAIVMNLPNIFYVWVAAVQPETVFMYWLTAIEQFAYGFGMASYMIFALYLSQRSRHSTSHYAIATGLMALSAMLAGSLSGYLQKGLGYFWFFVVVCLATIPGMVLLRYIPLEERKEEI